MSNYLVQFKNGKCVNMSGTSPKTTLQGYFKSLGCDYSISSTKCNNANICCTDISTNKKYYYLLEIFDGIHVRQLTKRDKSQIMKLDKLACKESSLGYESGILDLLEDDCTYGLFENGLLIGYCSLGGGDEYQDIIDSYDIAVLSDVLIDTKYRGRGYAGFLLSKVLIKAKEEYEYVVISLLNDNLKYFYSKFGFKELHKGGSLMILKL